MALGKQKKPQAVTNISIKKRKRQRLFLSIAACLGVFSFYSFKTLYPKIEGNISYNKDLKEKEISIPVEPSENIENDIVKNISQEGKEKSKLPEGLLIKKDIQTVEIKKAEKIKTIVEEKTHKEVNKIVKIEKISNIIAEQYNVSPRKAKLVVKKAYELSKIHNVDPMTIIGITAVESEFNEKAKNPSGAVGLMQPLPRAHPDKIKELRKKGGSLYNIADNMEIGTSIYSEYLRKHNGNRTKALQQYNGALNDKKRIYAKKVYKAIHEIQLANN